MSTSAKGRLLFVEDQDSLRAVTEVALRRLGWEVDAVSCVDEAEQLLGSKSYQVVITDFDLGLRNGSEVIAAARNAQVSQIVLLTGNSKEELYNRIGEDEVREMLEGVKYLKKPFSISALSFD